MPRMRLRHFIYLVIIIIAAFKVLWPVCFIEANTVLHLIITLVLPISALELYWLIHRSYGIRGYLDQGDVERFIEATDKEIKFAFGRHWRRFYQINKTAGLYYLGRFEEAIALLDTIEYKKLQKIYRCLYVNNRLANLLGLERIEEAEELIRANEELIKSSTHNRKFYFALQANLGIFKYLKGEREVGRYLLEESIKEHKSKLGLAVAHYYLGRIDQDEGKDTEADAHFQKSKEFGKGIYISQKLNGQIKQ